MTDENSQEQKEDQNKPAAQNDQGSENSAAPEHPRRTLRQTFQGEFGVSDNPADHGFGRRPEVDDPDALRGERRPEHDHDSRPSYGERRPSYGERKPYGDRGARPSYGERKPYGDRGARPSYGERRPYGDRDSRPSYGERRPYGDRDSRPSYGERKPFGDRDSRPSYGERRPYGDRDSRPSYGERRPYGDRDSRPSYGERRPYGDRDSRPSYGNRDERRGNFRDSAPVFRQKPVSENPAESADLPRDEEAILAQADAPVVDAEAEENSSNPPWFRKLLALTTEKGREREGRFLAEGARVTQEMIDNHRDLIIGIYITDKGMSDPIVAKANEFAITVHTLTPEQMKKLSSTVSAQEIITVCRIASVKPDYEHSRSIITLVDAVQDPGNLGAIFRTSLGFESSGVVLGKGTVNPFNPKVVRGSSGTFLRVPFERDIDLVEHINFLRLKGYTVIATDLHAKQSLKEIKPSKMRKVAFLMGNEGAGTNQHLIEMADETVRIPMSNNLESLNVAVAHGILSYEMLSIQSNLEKDQGNGVQ